MYCLKNFAWGNATALGNRLVFEHRTILPIKLVQLLKGIVILS